MTGDELARLVEDGAVGVLDVRTREEDAGEEGYPCDPRQGHIPGAVHLEWSELFAAPGRPLDRDAIVAILRKRGLDPDTRIVTYCHSGQRSELAAVALRSAGLDATNYEGSWHEWSRRDE